MRQYLRLAPASGQWRSSAGPGAGCRPSRSLVQYITDAGRLPTAASAHVGPAPRESLSLLGRAATVSASAARLPSTAESERPAAQRAANLGHRMAIVRTKSGIAPGRLLPLSNWLLSRRVGAARTVRSGVGGAGRLESPAVNLPPRDPGSLCDP